MTDYTIAAQVKPPQVDPLATIGKYQGIAQTGLAIQQGQLQNKLLGQQVGSKLSMGKAFGGALGDDGQLDPAKVGQYYVAHPEENQFAPEAVSAAQQQRQAQIQQHIAEQGFTQAQLETAAKENANGARLGQAIQSGGDYSPQAIAKLGDFAAPRLFISPESQQQWATFKGMLTDDPKANAALVQQFVSAHTDIANAIGSVRDVNTGSHIAQVQTNPATGENRVNGQISLERSPESKAQLVPTYDPATKTTKLQTSGDIIGDAPRAAAQQPQTGPALGEADMAAGNVHQAQALQQRASIVPQRRAALSNLSNTLDSFTPGPKADLTYGLSALATQFGLPVPAAARGAAAQEEFNKLSAQIALDQWGALGGTGSNEQLNSTMKANPHQAMSKMGIKNVVALLQGNEDAIGSQFDAWKKYSAVHGPSSYGDFLQGWNKYYDPRVFQAAHMAAPDVKAMKAKMTPDELKTFTRDQNIAQQAGWLGK